MLFITSGPFIWLTLPAGYEAKMPELISPTHTSSSIQPAPGLLRVWV